MLYTNFYNYSTLRNKLNFCIKNHKRKNTVIKALFKNQWFKYHKEQDLGHDLSPGF